ncbi:MAG: bifunctional phosphopantothenoylcysteine decarboxylase/phosphopantothenate--cysteine ligase CoaBC [Anaerolineae bacterium]|nr:bifunctional phosphopantothenoylcysteine decarboxylase/phosphopantothenate--cysteine ligase CoaBC [Anaerolineae bacterium]
MSVLSGKRIILGVTGSIAAYKAADLASKLTQSGAQVDVILTSAAEKFITPLTFQSVTGRRAYTDSDLWGNEAHVLHVGLGHSADLIIIAPCTANTIAKLTHGQADTLLTVTALASTCPLVIAPAMDGGMFDHAATQENVATLKKRDIAFIGPAEGHLASGLSGKGRMLEPTEIIGHIRLILGRNGPLAGKKIVITAGGTQEPLDPVRVLTNRSSGKQGYALAQAALDLGADVKLITTPTSLIPPIGAKVIRVETAKQMLDAVLKESEESDALIMAAAVADFRPKNTAKNKIKKETGIPQIELEATEDILKTVSSSALRAGAGKSGALSRVEASERLVLSPGDATNGDVQVERETKRPRVVVGFAAESQDLLQNATNKLESKGLDLIVANDISATDAGFAVETNRVTLLFADGRRESLPLMSKTKTAELILERVAILLE